MIVHESTASHMEFKTKNFAYATKPFGDFMDAIEKGEKLYLRSLSSENARELPACLESDYPSLAANFQLPECLVSQIFSPSVAPSNLAIPSVWRLLLALLPFETKTRRRAWRPLIEMP